MGLSCWRAFGIVSAVLVLVACGPGPGDEYQAVIRAVLHGDDHVAVNDLAGWIIEDKADYVLLDTRPQAEFAKGHILGARNVPLSYLFDAQTFQELPAKRMLVLYSTDTVHAAQATALLRLAGYDAYALQGGYALWRALVLQPAQLDVVAEASESRKRQAIADYFSGKHDRTGSTEDPEMTQAPAAVSSPDAYTPPVVGILKEGEADELVEEEDLELIVEEGC